MRETPDPSDPRSRPQPVPLKTGEATTAQLRRDIDGSATGDKVAMVDPAAAPLGTDAEAAGAPPAPEAVAAARRTERARPNAAHHGAVPARNGPGAGLLVILILVMLALAAALLAMR